MPLESLRTFTAVAAVLAAAAALSAGVMGAVEEGLLSLLPGEGETALKGRSRGAEFGRSCPLNKSAKVQLFA